MSQYELKPGPHEGIWIMKDGQVYMWCFSLERAQLRLQELQRHEN